MAAKLKLMRAKFKDWKKGTWDTLHAKNICVQKKNDLLEAKTNILKAIKKVKAKKKYLKANLFICSINIAPYRLSLMWWWIMETSKDRCFMSSSYSCTSVSLKNLLPFGPTVYCFHPIYDLHHLIQSSWSWNHKTLHFSEGKPQVRTYRHSAPNTNLQTLHSNLST